MSSVLVVIVLLGMWAFVLVPLVRQRNVRTDEIRSVARFSSALRVLSRGHGSPSDAGWGSGWGRQLGMRQWVMPPREGLAAARQRRLAATADRPVSGPAATRRRRLMTWLAAAVTFTLLLTVVGGRLFLVVQVLADLAFAAGIVACRSSVAQERAVAVRDRRRRETRELRRSLHDVSSAGRSWSLAPDEVQVMTVPLGSGLPAPVPSMTVPLDAPAQSRRAAPTLDPPARRPVARHEDALPVRRAAPPRPAPARPAPARPRAEPVVLAEIDLDWEPAVPEPASCVRLVDVGGGSRARRIFDEAPADGVDVGDDAELDALVQRRLAASGW